MTQTSRKRPAVAFGSGLLARPREAHYRRAVAGLLFRRQFGWPSMQTQMNTISLQPAIRRLILSQYGPQAPLTGRSAAPSGQPQNSRSNPIRSASQSSASIAIGGKPVAQAHR